MFQLLKPISVFSITLFLLFVSMAVVAQNDERQPVPRENALSTAVEVLAKDPDLLNASWGFYAIDATSGEIVAEWNKNTSLAPASNVKVISTATALEVLSPDYQFETTIEYSGTITNTVLHGNIYIRGGGDPALGSERFPEYQYPAFMQQWVKAIDSLGIKQVEGAVIGDAQIYDSQFLPESWTWGNMGNYFGAGACGLSIYDNTYKLFFNSGATVGELTTISKTEPEIPGLVFENKVTAENVSGDNAYIYGAPYADLRIITGSIPKSRTDFEVKGSIPDPAWLAAYQLSQQLAQAGISVANEPTTQRRRHLEGLADDTLRTAIYTTLSPQLKTIVTKTNHISMNLYAEHCLTHVGVHTEEGNDTDAGTDAVTRFWAAKGMDTNGFYLHDGSGLSRYNAITPRQFVYILRYMKNNSEHWETFYESLPIAGESGTIRRMCRGTAAQGNLRAKSGSIRNVRGYCGYVTTRSGRELVFSMMANNFNCSSYQMRKKFESLMVVMANLNI